jgi:hypothetical protein
MRSQSSARRSSLRPLAIMAILCALAGSTAIAQTFPTQRAPGSENPHTLPDPTPRQPDYRKKYDQDPAQLKKLKQAEMLKNQMRQDKMVSDTDKLVQLAEEVKKEMDADQTASPKYAQAMKVEEIEKLAKNVKQKMRSE